MAKRGLDSGQIFDEAEKLVTEKGYDNFSVRELASRLGVKPASLYNHINGLEEINVEIALRSASKMGTAIQNAVAGKSPDEAFIDGTRAYRKFAIENPELYKAFVRRPLLNDETALRAGFQSFSPLRDIVMSYGLNEKDSLNYIRGLRSVMHGFIELTNNGFMQRGDISQDESYDEIMANYLAALKSKSSDAEVRPS